MHPRETRDRALSLIASGLSDRQVAELVAVPPRTVLDWRRRPEPERPRCPRCDGLMRPITLDRGDYAELLGLYLGDGHISPGRRTSALRISLDRNHPEIDADTLALLRRGFPQNRVQRLIADRGNTVVQKVYHCHLRCLFPQAGPGRKQDRPILLETWQQDIVDRKPWRLLRGLIRSDGCVFVNRTGPYEYLSYDFTNHSQDILDLFAATCTAVGVQHRRYPVRIRVCQRPSVALLLHHVGVKS